MIAALADGTIDAIASDHQPRDADDKRLPFALASAGGCGPGDAAGGHAGACPQRIALACRRDRSADRSAGGAAGHVAPDGSPRVPSPICACSIRSGSGRSKPANFRARRRTRRSTAERWKVWCWGPGSAASGCSADRFTLCREVAHDASDHRHLPDRRPECVRGASRPEPADVRSRMGSARRDLHALPRRGHSGPRRSDGQGMAGISRQHRHPQSAERLHRVRRERRIG